MQASSFKANLKLFENGASSEIPYLYLDTKGEVTIGTGLMYKTARALILDRLRFTINGSIKDASDEQIKKAFEAVKKCARGLPAERYKGVKDNNITADIDRLAAIFNSRIERARNIAIEWFAHDTQNDDPYRTFDSLPEDIQYALIDMAYNMGSNEAQIKGLAKFKKFRRALHEGDFATAATESYRPDCKRGSLRNQRVYDWINQYSSGMLGRAFSDRSLA